MAPRLSPDPEVAEFDGQLFFRLWRASHTRTTEALAAVGLTPALFGVLNVVGARDGVIQSRLSADMGIDPSAMVTLVDELETKGWAERRRRAGDRRAWEVTVTTAGRRQLRRARDLATKVEDDVLAGLDAGEREQLLALLRRALRKTPPAPLWRAEESG